MIHPGNITSQMEFFLYTLCNVLSGSHYGLEEVHPVSLMPGKRSYISSFSHGIVIGPMCTLHMGSDQLHIWRRKSGRSNSPAVSPPRCTLHPVAFGHNMSKSKQQLEICDQVQNDISIGETGACTVLLSEHFRTYTFFMPLLC